MRCWLACKPIVRRSAQPATKSWSATASELPRPCGLRDTVKFFSERLTVPSLVGLTWQEHVPPCLTAKLSKPRCPPGGALL